VQFLIFLFKYILFVNSTLQVHIKYNRVHFFLTREGWLMYMAFGVASMSAEKYLETLFKTLYKESSKRQFYYFHIIACTLD